VIAANSPAVWHLQSRRPGARFKLALAALLAGLALIAFGSARADAAFNKYYCGTGSSNHCNAISGVWDDGESFNYFAFINAYRGSGTTTHCGSLCGIYVDLNPGPGQGDFCHAGISWGTAGISCAVSPGAPWRSRSFCDIANASSYPWATCYKNRD